MTEDALTTLEASIPAGDEHIAAFDNVSHSETGRSAERGSSQAGRRAEEAGGRTYVFIIHDGIRSCIHLPLGQKKIIEDILHADNAGYKSMSNSDKAF